MTSRKATTASKATPSLRVALELRRVPASEVREATELIARAHDRVLRELRLAAEVAGRREAMRA